MRDNGKTDGRRYLMLRNGDLAFDDAISKGSAALEEEQGFSDVQEPSEYSENVIPPTSTTGESNSLKNWRMMNLSSVVPDPRSSYTALTSNDDIDSHLRSFPTHYEDNEVSLDFSPNVFPPPSPPASSTIIGGGLKDSQSTSPGGAPRASSPSKPLLLLRRSSEIEQFLAEESSSESGEGSLGGKMKRGLGGLDEDDEDDEDDEYDLGRRISHNRVAGNASWVRPPSTSSPYNVVINTPSSHPHQEDAGSLPQPLHPPWWKSPFSLSSLFSSHESPSHSSPSAIELGDLSGVERGGEDVVSREEERRGATRPTSRLGATFSGFNLFSRRVWPPYSTLGETPGSPSVTDVQEEPPPSGGEEESLGDTRVSPSSGRTQPQIGGVLGVGTLGLGGRGGGGMEGLHGPPTGNSSASSTPIIEPVSGLHEILGRRDSAWDPSGNNIFNQNLNLSEDASDDNPLLPQLLLALGFFFGPFLWVMGAMVCLCTPAHRRKTKMWGLMNFLLAFIAFQSLFRGTPEPLSSEYRDDIIPVSQHMPEGPNEMVTMRSSIRFLPNGPEKKQISWYFEDEDVNLQGWQFIGINEATKGEASKNFFFPFERVKGIWPSYKGESFSLSFKLEPQKKFVPTAYLSQKLSMSGRILFSTEFAYGDAPSSSASQLITEAQGPAIYSFLASSDMPNGDQSSKVYTSSAFPVDIPIERSLYSDMNIPPDFVGSALRCTKSADAVSPAFWVFLWKQADEAASLHTSGRVVYFKQPWVCQAGVVSTAVGGDGSDEIGGEGGYKVIGISSISLRRLF